MTFMHMSLLIGGCLLPVIPVVLHLLMRGKARHIEFPALRFVQSRSRTNQRRFQMRHLLLLLMRMLLIGLLGFALARPSIKTAGMTDSQEAPVAAAMVFDTSPGMDYTRDNQTSLDRAQELADWILTQLPEESQVSVVDGRRQPASFQVDMKAAAERIARLKTRSDSRTITQSIERAIELLRQSDKSQRELYIYTDMTARGWSSSSASRVKQMIEQVENLGVYVIDVGTNSPINTGIEQLKMSADVIAGHAPVQIDLQLTHWGPATERIVELYTMKPGVKLDTDNLDDGPIQEMILMGEKQGQQTVRFDPENPRQPVTFSLLALEDGLHQGMLRLVGEDALEADNTRWFTVEVRSAWRVLLVAPKPAAEFAVYMREALAPASFRRSGIVQFECDTINTEQLAAHIAADRLNDYAAIMLLDPASIGREQWHTLSNWVASGRGLGVFLGRESGPNKALFNTDEAQTLLAGPLVRQARSPGGRLFLAPNDYQNPVLATFQHIEVSIPWSVSPVYRYWQLGELNRGVTVAVPYSDGRPAILLRPVGLGRTVTMTTSLSDPASDKPWNLLPISDAAWPFVILADGLAKYLVGSGEQDYNYISGQTVTLHTDPNRVMRSYVLEKPSGDNVRQTPDLDRHLLSFSSIDEPGNYRVRAGGSENAVNFGFSVNTASSQINLDRIEPDELKNAFGDYPLQLAENREQIERGVAHGRVGRELFPLLALLLAILLTGELILSNRFYK